jgi:hypothetical protein
MSEQNIIRNKNAWAAYAGLAAAFLAILGSFLLGFFKSGYNPVVMTISELGERGASTFVPAAALFIAIGICEMIFAVGLFLRHRKSKLALAGTILLCINGFSDYIGSGVFPVDQAGTYESFSGQMHFYVSVIGMVVMIFPAFFYWRVFKTEGKTSQSRLSLIFALIIVAAAIVFNIAFFSGSLIGLAQRLLGGFYFLWIACLSAYMLARRD